jgi:tetratricopeptide (TPR) repeat protein
MRCRWFCLAVLACGSWLAHAGECDAIDIQLQSVAKQLSHADVSGAERALSPLEAAHPECAELVLDRARIQAANGSDEAEETFGHYTGLNPGSAAGWAYFARFLAAQGEFERADSAARIAIGCDASNPVAMAMQGQLLDMKGASKEAIRLLEQAIRLNPDDAEARFQLGAIHDRAKHLMLAARYFAEDVAIAPSDARGWDYLALSLEPLGEVERAQQAYQRGLAENRPGAYFDAFLPYNYGRFLMKRNQLSASKDQLDKAVELTPQARAVWYERARLNLRMNSLQQARADAEKAVGIEEPQVVIADLQLYVLLEQIYTRLGEAALARKYAELSRVTPSPVEQEMDQTR